MPAISKLKYQSCREAARLTQEQAASLLGIEPTTLSRYENGHYPVPQDIVASMVKVYRTPTLAWWHILHVNKELSLHLPEPPQIVTIGDLMLRLEFADDDIGEIREILKSVMGDEIIDINEADILETSSAKIRAVASKLISMSGYLDEQIMKVRTEGQACI